jgi:hypothetical protein
VRRCSGGEGGGPVARGAAPKLDEAPRPVQGNGKAVSRVAQGGRNWRRIVEMVAAYRSGHQDLDVDKRQWAGPPFIAAHHGEQCRPVVVGDSSVRRQSESALVLHSGNRHREGHVRGYFVRMLASGDELDKEGARRGHAVRLACQHTVPMHT